MGCEIRISGPWRDLCRLRAQMSEFAPQLELLGTNRPGLGRISCLVEEEKLDARLVVLSQLLDEVEQEQPGVIKIQVRRLRGSEPPAGSAQYVEKFRPIPKLTIQPWHPDWPVPSATDTVLLDPDTSFGTGKHPSTQLCLEMLDQLVDKRQPDRMLLDLGCGTGVLAIAALKLGAAATALAVDIDPEAVRVAAGNVELNALAERITVCQGSWAAVSGRFDLIVANLVPSVLLSIGSGLRDHLQGSGSVIVAGFRAGQTEMVADSLAVQGLRVQGRADREGWAAFRLE